jgi:hypothetical protein
MIPNENWRVLSLAAAWIFTKVISQIASLIIKTF